MLDFEVVARDVWDRFAKDTIIFIEENLSVRVSENETRLIQIRDYKTWSCLRMIHGSVIQKKVLSYPSARNSQ